jgi:hypothetical protein
MASDPPRVIWLVKPKSDASFYAVYEDEDQARARVEQSASGAEMAGPYVLKDTGENDD